MSALRRLYRDWRVRRAVARLAGTHALSALARARPDAVFVQVGANDGRMMDPLRESILATRWRGLVVEPVPVFFERLRANYASLADRVQPVNAAVASQTGEATFYYLADDAAESPLPDWAAGLGSFRKDVILGHASRIPGIERYLREIRVPCLSWPDLCERYAVERPDLVLTDTEGYDYEILRQVDLQRQRPGLLVYEHHHFDAETDSQCTRHLKRHGYALFREGLDTWAIDEAQAASGWARAWRDWVARSPHAAHV